eukprot:Anaeramoba_ignava/a90141_120.p1 GENE.a90141_120~~a90141_120.p1  ORF type:complete len:618 (-),score=124.85 a90141_120:2340-4193(-)
MKKLDELREFHQSITNAYYDIEMEQAFPNYFYDAFLSGENEMYQKSITELKSFHVDWIPIVESFLPSLNKIIMDPKSGLRYEQPVVPIEKAKKVNAQSIRHLSMHSHLIKEIRDDMVIPKKIMTTQAEIDYGIYENRFIKTLIERLFEFVFRRYNLIKANIESLNKRHFDLDSKFDMYDTNINMNLHITFTEQIDNQEAIEKNNKMVARIEALMKQVNGFMSTLFWEELKNAKPVKAPIMQTSILLKNVDYKNCYTLWLYLDRFSNLDFDNEVTEKNLTFDTYYTRNIYQIVLQTVTMIYGNQLALEDHYKYLDEKEYRKKSPKIITKRLEELLTQDQNLEMEDFTLNQYFLEESKKQFTKLLNEKQEESSSYDVALRRALRDTIQITNSLFESYFELNNQPEGEDFMFRSLLKESMYDQLQTARQKARIMKIIRETKEVDYNNMMRLEKRLLKEVEYLNKQYLEQEKENIADEAKKASLAEKLKIERQNAEKDQNRVSRYLKYVSNQHKKLEENHKKTTEKIRKTREKVKLSEKQIIAAEKRKAKAAYQAELKRIKEQHAADKKKLQAQLAKQKEKDQKRLETQEENIAKASEKRIAMSKKKIEEQYAKKLKKAKS